MDRYPYLEYTVLLDERTLAWLGNLHFLLHIFKTQSIMQNPISLPPVDVDGTQHIHALCETTKKNYLIPFRELLAKLSGACSSDVPPVSRIIYDRTIVRDSS